MGGGKELLLCDKGTVLEFRSPTCCLWVPVQSAVDCYYFWIPCLINYYQNLAVLFGTDCGN